MTAAAWVDTDAARRVAAEWSARGDDLHRDAFGLQHSVDELRLGDGLGTHHLTAAASSLWGAAGFLRLVADRVEQADRGFDVGDARDVSALLGVANMGVATVPATACLPDWTATTFSALRGDLGETGDVELRSPYLPFGRTPDERGRSLLLRALADTADERQIRVDEFEIVRIDSSRYVVVLPGVTDLTHPDPGWSEQHRSVRDVDQAAFASSRSTGIDGNPYARLVWESLATAGVPAGAELMIVGHSFGADTALDLAADVRFNGPGAYRVTHVVAAAYHSEPQLEHVAPDTEVLVLLNRFDLPVIVERSGHGHATESVANRIAAADDLRSFDLPEAAKHAARSWGHDIGALADASTYVAGHVDDVVRVATGLTLGRPSIASAGFADLVATEPGVTRPRHHQVVDVFTGEGRGGGHHQTNYLDHLEQVDDDLVVDFFRSVDAAGYARAGTAVAVDVSVPG